MSTEKTLLDDAKEALGKIDPDQWNRLYAARLLADLKVSEDQREKVVGQLLRSITINQAALRLEESLRTAMNEFILDSGWRYRDKRKLKPTAHRWLTCQRLATRVTHAVLDFCTASSKQAAPVRPKGSGSIEQAHSFFVSLADKPKEEQKRLLVDYLKLGVVDSGEEPS